MEFNAKKTTRDIIKWIRNFFEENGKHCNAVIGMSGGKDSSVAAALCVKALGADRVIGVIMPNGVQKDKYDAVEVCDILGIRYMEINIDGAYNHIIESMDAIYNPARDGYETIKPTSQTKINLPARLRMATLYAVSQSMSGRVVNTCNLSEDYVGYSTRYGDSAGDFSPLGKLTTDEVIAIGLECGLPEHVVHKTPSDGLSGLTDEDNLGFSYEVLNKYIRTGVCADTVVRERIAAMHEKNIFKLLPMPTFPYNGEITVYVE